MYYWDYLQQNPDYAQSADSISGFIGMIFVTCSYSKVHGANMGPLWDQQDPGGPHVGPMNFAI